MDIIKTNERITRLVMSGELDAKQAKVLYQGVNSAIKALELNLPAYECRANEIS